MDAKNPNFIRALTHMAWADGHLAPQEKELLKRYMHKMGLSDAEAEAALMSPGPEPDFEALARELPNPRERIELVRTLMQLSFSDDTLTSEEFDIFERAARILRLSDEDLEAIRAELAT